LARCAVEVLVLSTNTGEDLKVTIAAELEAHILRLYLTLRIMSGNRLSSIDRPSLRVVKQMCSIDYAT